MNNIQNYGFVQNQVGFKSAKKEIIGVVSDKFANKKFQIEKDNNVFPTLIKPLIDKLESMGVSYDALTSAIKTYDQMSSSCYVIKDNSLMIDRVKLQKIFADTLGKVLNSPEKLALYKRYVEMRQKLADLTLGLLKDALEAPSYPKEMISIKCPDPTHTYHDVQESLKSGLLKEKFCPIKY